MDKEELGLLVAVLTKKLGGDATFTLEEFLDAAPDAPRVNLTRVDNEFRVWIQPPVLDGTLVAEKAVEQ